MSPNKSTAVNRISTYNEKPLHAALKEYCAEPGDRFEVAVDGSLIDIVRGKLLIEIQTRNFGALKRKLRKLVKKHRVRLVLPIARARWIVKESKDGAEVLGRRRSPKRGTIEHLFEELVYLPDLLAQRRFELEVLLTEEEEVRRQDGTARAWRRKGWVTRERRLLRVVERRLFKTPRDLAALVPPELEEPFTTRELAQAMGRRIDIAQKMAYCLRALELLLPVGKQGNAILYQRAKPPRKRKRNT